MPTTNTSITARFELAETVIREAGALALGFFRALGTLTIETKANGQDVVSQADKEVEALLKARILSAFPDDGFLGEETGLTAGTTSFTWIIDPIDGTSCFLHDLPTWCVVIALVQEGRTVMGIVFDPNADEIFTAIEGNGAFLNGNRISVDMKTDLQHGLTSVGANGRIPGRVTSNFILQLLDKGGMFVRSGSGALSLAHVACGRLAAYYEPHMNVWDCLAAQCLIREAGGWANDVLSEGSLLGGGEVFGCAPQLRDDLRALAAFNES